MIASIRSNSMSNERLLEAVAELDGRYAVPRSHIALAEMLDRESLKLKTGAEHRHRIAEQLRRIADVLAGEI